MAIAPARELKVGRIIEATLDVIEGNAVPAIIFVVAIALLNGALVYFGLGYTAPMQEVAKAIASFIISVVAAYLLFEAILRRSGYLERGDEDAFLPYVLLSILYTIAVTIGFILIIFPGLYLMARWSTAQPLLIARGKGAIAALKESWERTQGSEFAIIIVVLILFVVPAGLSVFITTQFEPDNLLGIGINQVVSSAASMAGVAMGVALYRLIILGSDATAAKTFE